MRPTAAGLAIAASLSACTVASERPAEAPDWLYERLTPDLVQTVRVDGRRARVFVHNMVPTGGYTCGPDGPCFHWDGFKSEIEVFFGTAIGTQAETTATAWQAAIATCPELTQETAISPISTATLRYVRFGGKCLTRQ